MSSNNLIIVSPLLNPPSDSLAIRCVLMVCTSNIKLDCLVETQKDFRDFYYIYCKKFGHMDYIKDLILPTESERGIRLDFENNYPLTVKTRDITFENQIRLIGQIKYLSKF